MMKTIFFGASSYVLPLIAYLKSNFDLALVITTESKPTDAVPMYCKTNNIPFLMASKLDEETIDKIKNIAAPFAVLADFRLLIKQGVIDIFPKGIINIHPSLLPEYRGPTPGVAALLDGKNVTGVSLMILDKELDHGPLIGQEKEKIESDDTSVTLYTKLFKRGAELLKKNLPHYLKGEIEPIQQDHSKAIYTEFLTRESGYFDKNKHLSKEKLEHMIKAYFPWPSVWTKWKNNGKEKIVKFLPSNMVQIEGKKPVSYKDFINGYPEGKDFLEDIGIL